MTERLTWAVAETPIGAAGVMLSGKGIRRATLFHATREAVLAELTAWGATEAEEGPRAKAIEAALVAFGTGERRDALDHFPVDLDEGTELQREVWMTLREIPAGETRTYAWLARRLGRAPGAARAIGAAVGANPAPPWLPCHRVIGSDGGLRGFRGGLAMKRQLLEIEGVLLPGLA